MVNYYQSILIPRTVPAMRKFTASFAAVKPEQAAAAGTPPGSEGGESEVH